MHDTLSRKEIDQSLLTLDDRIMNADEFVEFALSQKTVNIVDKVDDKLENLKYFHNKNRKSKTVLRPT